MSKTRKSFNTVGKMNDSLGAVRKIVREVTGQAVSENAPADFIITLEGLQAMVEKALQTTDATLNNLRETILAEEASLTEEERERLVAFINRPEDIEVAHAPDLNFDLEDSGSVWVNCWKKVALADIRAKPAEAPKTEGGLPDYVDAAELSKG